MKQLKIFNDVSKKLIADKSISSIMLMGSAAQVTARPESDLDIMVLGSKNKFRI